MKPVGVNDAEYAVTGQILVNSRWPNILGTVTLAYEFSLHNVLKEKCLKINIKFIIIIIVNTSVF